MLVWLTLPFYDFCGFRSVAVNSVYKLQFLHIFYYLSHAICYSCGADSLMFNGLKLWPVDVRCRRKTFTFAISSSDELLFTTWYIV